MDSLPPEPTSVYLYRDANDVLIYVGVTKRGIKRQAEHNATKDWWHLVARQDVEHFDTRPEALHRERDLIVKHSPPFNTQHNPDAGKVRAAYLLFAAAMAQSGTVLEEMSALNRQIPLVHHQIGNQERVVLRTRVDDALLSAVLTMPPFDKPATVQGLQRNKRQATKLLKIEKVGPVALLHLSKANTHPIRHANASVRYDNKRRLLVVRNVQVTLDHSDVSLCNPRCPKHPQARWIRPDGEGAA